MKIGIIVHSQTGNTLSVAERLKERLVAGGHSVDLERVTPVDEKPSGGVIKLKEVPDTDPYELLFFAAPVQAFSLSPVMKTYLAQLPPLQGKRACCFVTQYFPFPWLGGNRAISQMQKALQSKGVKTGNTSIINWSRKDRDKQIEDLVETLSKL